VFKSESVIVTHSLIPWPRSSPEGAPFLDTRSKRVLDLASGGSQQPACRTGHLVKAQWLTLKMNELSGNLRAGPWQSNKPIKKAN